MFWTAWVLIAALPTTRAFSTNPTCLVVSPLTTNQRSGRRRRLAVHSSSNNASENSYEVPKYIFAASAVRLLSTDVASAGSYVIATTATQCLAKAKKSQRIDSPTYSRLNIALLVWGALAILETTGFFWQGLHCLGMVYFLGGALQNRSVKTAFFSDDDPFFFRRKPSNTKARCYAGLTVLPTLLAFLASPTLGAFLLTAVSLIVLDAANRNRLDATTFRRLNQALAATFLGTAASTLYPLVGTGTTNLFSDLVAVLAPGAPRRHLLGALVAVVAAGPPAFFSWGRHLQRK